MLTVAADNHSIKDLVHMTVDDLYKLMCDKAAAEPERVEVPEDINVLLRQIAEWMHISQEGFEKSDIEHMRAECRVLIGTLSEVHKALGGMLADAKDADDC